MSAGVTRTVGVLERVDSDSAREPARSCLYVMPMNYDEANELVRRWHRHHRPVNTFRFAIGVFDDAGKPHGAVIVGPPVARLAGHPRTVAEVTRLVTDGTPNACSMLYAAAARAAQAMGFERIQTFILHEEPGSSLRGAGWDDEGTSAGGNWFRDGNPKHQQQTSAHLAGKKRRWAKRLNPPRPEVVMAVADESGSVSLWDDAA